MEDEKEEQLVNVIRVGNHELEVPINAVSVSEKWRIGYDRQKKKHVYIGSCTTPEGTRVRTYEDEKMDRYILERLAEAMAEAAFNNYSTNGSNANDNCDW